MPILRPKISKEELKEAYIKLKSHIYYDTTELFQRRKLAEFETGLLSDEFLFGSTPYAKGIFNLSVELEDKFDKIIEWINTHHRKKVSTNSLIKLTFSFFRKNSKKKKKKKTLLPINAFLVTTI